MDRDRESAGADDGLSIRPACKADAREIARLFLMSSDGLAAYIWAKAGEGTGDLLDIGAARYGRENTAFSYQNCHLAEVEGQICGMLHAFEMTADGGVETDPVLRPYAELEDPGSLYVSGLAVDEAFRQRGIGHRLAGFAKRLATARGLPRVSLICFERNGPALALYLARGYKITDRRAVVPHPSLHYDGGDAVLMIKAVAPG